MDTLEGLAFKQPFPIQSQAIPAILQGRDLIGIAETGSGKTLAYLLPALTHISFQRPLTHGEGPIALVFVPTRELALQIIAAGTPFCAALGLRMIAAAGGSPLQAQIASFKRGGEIVVGTPGRIIDMLTLNKGKITNLRRVSFVVIDEADRMFDMGFEPQISKIMANVRPDRQTVLFSATFPRNV
jgi:ATP-dependent RNA helicase DDX46/PRP5